MLINNKTKILVRWYFSQHAVAHPVRMPMIVQTLIFNK